MRITKTEGVLLFVLGGWLTAVAMRVAKGDYAIMGAVGDSLAPIGTIVTAMALHYGFRHRHHDAVRAHNDARAEAYVFWFERAWGAISRHREEYRSASEKEPHHIRPVLLSTETMVRELRMAATRPGLIERDKELAKRLQDSFRPFEVWTGPVKAEEMVAYTQSLKDLSLELKKRQDEIERLFEDASKQIANR